MPPITYSRFLKFLQEELNLSQNSIAIAKRSSEQNPSLIPMILWQYGLINLDQLDQIYDWLESF
jgi:hypothetical protein